MQSTKVDMLAVLALRREQYTVFAGGVNDFRLVFSLLHASQVVHFTCGSQVDTVLSFAPLFY